MKILFYSTKDFERVYLQEANLDEFEIKYIEDPLSADTAQFAKNYDVISVFTGDDVSAPVLKQLKKAGVKFIAVRAAGYDNVDISAANEYGIQVANVPEYSPYAIAEHAVA